jgi:hypothetical protein
MKKTFVFILLILSTSLLVSAKDFMVTLYCDFLSVADEDYKEEYGGRKFFPEIKIAFRLKGNIFLWGSCGYLPVGDRWYEWSNKGVVESDVEVKNRSKKLFFSGGLGYYVGYVAKSDIAVKAELGFCTTTHSIKLTANQTTTNEVLRSEESKDSGIGIRGNLGVTYGIFKNIFAEASVGYLYVWSKVNDETINAGGLRLAIGLGLKL